MSLFTNVLQCTVLYCTVLYYLFISSTDILISRYLLFNILLLITYC